MEFSAQMLAGKTLEEWLSECRERYYRYQVAGGREGEPRGIFLSLLEESGYLGAIRESLGPTRLVRIPERVIELLPECEWYGDRIVVQMGYRNRTGGPIDAEGLARERGRQLGRVLRKRDGDFKAALVASGLDDEEGGEILTEWLQVVASEPLP